MMTVRDRSAFEGRIREAIAVEFDDEDSQADATRRRRPSTRTGTAASAADRTGGAASQAASAKKAHRPPAGAHVPSDTSAAGFGVSSDEGSRRQLPEERRYQEMLHKKEKHDAVRDRDQKLITERIESSKDLREARFKRLLSSMTGEGTLAFETAMDLRERSEREEARRRELYKDWDENIFQPMAAQAHRRLNPPDRRFEQALSGTRSVTWSLPGDEEIRLIHKVRDCPVRRPMVEHAKENAFHLAAEKVLGRSQSAPILRGGAASGGLDLPSRTSGVLGYTEDEIIPKARSKETLDPTVWSQTRIQDTLYGHFAQKSEQGKGFKACIRQGPNMHLPDESDGVPVAGVRFSRATGYNDKGILVGERAARGESSVCKTFHGRSSAAPAQDHFTFETGRRVTDLEFPLGRRPPPAGMPR